MLFRQFCRKFLVFCFLVGILRTLQRFSMREDCILCILFQKLRLFDYMLHVLCFCGCFFACFCMLLANCFLRSFFASFSIQFFRLPLFFLPCSLLVILCSLRSFCLSVLTFFLCVYDSKLITKYLFYRLHIQCFAFFLLISIKILLFLFAFSCALRCVLFALLS